ncbi:MAG: nuclear transport factor 2 family protein [Deltaproteobacteria bacterium]|nr:nuclear transport factor 2 family protein [Deltaproteobacteria bacterium]
MTQDLETRIARIEDRIAISELRAHYCFLIDQGRGREAVDLFTEDGEFHGLDSCRGREELLRFFGETIPQTLPAMWHLVHNEIIHIDGNSATGQCYFEMPCVLKGESYVCAGHYDDVLVKQEGKWKFKSRKVTFYYLVPLKEGWARERMRFRLE